MGKIDDPYTPEQRALLKKFVRNFTPEERAALRIKRIDLKPPLSAKVRKTSLVPKSTGASAPVQNRARRDGKQKKKTRAPKKEGPKERRVNAIARDLWPPSGKPPAKLLNVEIVKKVGDVYQRRHDGQTVDRTTILRSQTIGRLRPPR
ncbi:hypothetical protein ABIG06_004714 [Bradyrhizobium sp. USDA 326]|uniref:hypothetical protein n=1 Tax=unclassified Bradyrhizobium TaxID=2631580 RepID=UPI00351117BC